MPRSGPNGTYTLPGAQATQQPGTPIPSAVNNQGWSDAEQTFNTIQPRAYGGTDSSDLKLNDANFGVRNNADATKIGVFNAAGLPTATTRTYDLPYYSGTLGLVSDIRGQIYGLTCSNNVTDPTNDIDIAAGAAVDSTGSNSIVLASGLTKRADAVWAAGSGNGGRFYTTLVDGTIHYYVIWNPTTGVADAGLSDNATNPTGGASYPAGFTRYRRIFSITRSGGSIRAFYQRGDDVYLNAPGLDYTQSNPGTAAITVALTCPTGLILDAKIRVRVVNSLGTNLTYGLFTPLAIADAVPSLAGAPLADTTGAMAAAGSSSSPAAVLEVPTNTSAQIRARLADTSAGISLHISCYGWRDTRGRDA